MKKVKVLLPNGAVNYHYYTKWSYNTDGFLTIISDRDIATVYAAGGWWYAQDVEDV